MFVPSHFTLWVSHQLDFQCSLCSVHVNQHIKTPSFERQNLTYCRFLQCFYFFCSPEMDLFLLCEQSRHRVLKNNRMEKITLRTFSMAAFKAFRKALGSVGEAWWPGILWLCEKAHSRWLGLPAVNQSGSFGWVKKLHDGPYVVCRGAVLEFIAAVVVVPGRNLSYTNLSVSQRTLDARPSGPEQVMVRIVCILAVHKAR